ncbi:MAG: hypothetical protein ABIV11_04025 [Gemmatimonadaceae bacterium]
MSTEASGTGMSSMLPDWQSIEVPEAAAWLCAFRHMAGFRSTPITVPVEPTCQPATIESRPAPLPRSRTVSPGFSSLRRWGLPTPANEATAAAAAAGARSSQSAG